jgi:hypothetical protein
VRDIIDTVLSGMYWLASIARLIIISINPTLLARSQRKYLRRDDVDRGWGSRYPEAVEGVEEGKPIYLCSCVVLYIRFSSS